MADETRTVQFIQPSITTSAENDFTPQKDEELPENDVITEDSIPEKGVRILARDPDRFLIEAKKLVVDNYNSHRNRERSPELTTELVYVVWFTKTLANWKAIIGSPVLNGLMYEVSYDGRKSMAYIDVYRKINNVKIAY